MQVNGSKFMMKVDVSTTRILELVHASGRFLTHMHNTQKIPRNKFTTLPQSARTLKEDTKTIEQNEL